MNGYKDASEAFIKDRKYLATTLLPNIRKLERGNNPSNPTLVEVSSRFAATPTEVVETASIVPKTGLIKEIVDYITSVSFYPQPELATMATVCFLGSVIGRGACTKSGFYPNIYGVGIAPSGSGKEKARTELRKISNVCGVELGPGRVASGVALLNYIREHGGGLLLMDEFGMQLQAMTDSRASTHSREIITVFTEAFTAAQSFLAGTMYASTEKKDNIKKIYNPVLNVYGTSTEGEFMKAIHTEHSTSGFLPRMLYVKAGIVPPVRYPEVGSVPQGIINQIERIKEVYSTHNTAPTLQFDNQIVVGFRHDVEEDIWLYRSEIIPEKQKLSDSASAVYSRVVENALKLALIKTCADSKTVIDMEAWQWGLMVAMQSADYIYNAVKNNANKTREQSELERIEDEIRNAGENGITRKALMRAIRMNKYRLDEYIATLLESERITVRAIRTEGAKKDTSTYYHTDYLSA